MNTLDMQSREKVNQIHIAEMHQAARKRRQVRELKPARSPAISISRLRLMLLALALILFVAFFIAATPVL